MKAVEALQAQGQQLKMVNLIDQTGDLETKTPEALKLRGWAQRYIAVMGTPPRIRRRQEEEEDKKKKKKKKEEKKKEKKKEEKKKKEKKKKR